jgi:Initiator Rep protein, WH2
MNRCVESFSISEFRDQIGVPPGAYERGNNFLQFVINPAVIEVNGLSDMGVRLEVRRKHARVPIEGVTLAWWRKHGDEFRAALQERNRSKLGRIAQLRRGGRRSSRLAANRYAPCGNTNANEQARSHPV